MIIQLKHGLVSLSLTALFACSTVPPKPVNNLAITPCTLQTIKLETNQDLILAYLQQQADFALCAAKVDALIGNK